MKKKKDTSQLEKRLDLQVLTLKQSGRWLTKHLFYAIKHLPDNEELIFKVFKNCVLILFLIKKSNKAKNKIISMLGSQRKSNWKTFLDNLTTSRDQSMLTIQLLQMLVQELISREKDFQPFWTPAFKGLSEKLSLPTKTDFVGLDSTLLNNWSQNQEVVSPFLIIKKTKQVNKNLQKTCCPLFMSSHVAKWEKEIIKSPKLKTLIVKIYPTSQQKKVINEFIDTSRYVYNKTVETIRSGHKVNFQDLRDLLVTENTKKNLQAYKDVDSMLEKLKKQKKECTDKEEKTKLTDAIKNIQKERRVNMKNFTAEKNSVVKEFELNTPKDIRANAVKRCCDAYTSGFANLRNGNIKFFRLEYKKKTRQKQSIELTPKNIKVEKGDIKILPTYFKDNCILKVSNNNQKKIQNIKIVSNVDLVRFHGCYYLHLCVPINEKSTTPLKQICGVDLGVRTFATVCSHNIGSKQSSTLDYQQRKDMLTTLNAKLDMLKKRRGKKTKKKQYNKIEKKKKDMVDLLHWQTVNHLLEHNDVIFLGDIKSHNIVKGNKNRALNRLFNDMKMYQFKQRLLYKASVAKKVVLLVKEHNTTKCCSSCGTINNVGCSKEFCCKSCTFATGRDVNASKNILMKGFLLL